MYVLMWMVVVMSNVGVWGDGAYVYDGGSGDNDGDVARTVEMVSLFYCLVGTRPSVALTRMKVPPTESATNYGRGAEKIVTTCARLAKTIYRLLGGGRSS